MGARNVRNVGLVTVEPFDPGDPRVRNLSDANTLLRPLAFYTRLEGMRAQG